MRIEVFGPSQELCDRAVRVVRDEIDRLDAMMTTWKPVSPVMDVNNAAGDHPVAVPDELFALIQRSLELSELTGGGFDITFAGAGKLWNWRDPNPTVPDDATVAAVLLNVGWRGVQLDPAKRTVFLTKRGMRIGLDGIAPGYAADVAMKRIQALGIRDAMIDMSGDVLVAGLRDGKPWKVGVQHPRRAGEFLAVLPVTNRAVSTSGDYERFFIKDGRRYCHIIDPHTGRPAELCQSVTILAPTLATADALTKGVFILGPAKGIEFVETQRDVEAIVVGADGTVHLSKGLKDAGK